MSSVHPPIGAHLSVAGGYALAVDRAVAVGADALQIFSGSPRVWARPVIVPETLQAFAKTGKEKGIRAIFVHSLYLVNLASDKTESVQKSINAIVNDLVFGSHFNCSGVVVHLGSHQGKGWDAVKEQVALQIQKIIDTAAVDTPFLIENSAGQKGKLCSDLAEVRWLLDRVDRPQLGWCYDTCHGWAAGYSATQPADAQHDLFATIDALDLWDSLRCVHVNDSRDPFASGRDRHANINEGSIVPGEWKALWSHPKFSQIRIITEVPGADGNGPDAENVSRIRAFFE